MKNQNSQAYNASIKRLTLFAKMLNPTLKRIPNPIPRPQNEEKAKAYDAAWAKRVDKSTIRYFAERPEFTENRTGVKLVDQTEKTLKDSVKI